ncbi:MAG: nucleotide exchange factor GrpE [Myxococcaceae bacterium]|nr:nucleotide exchange factor GrpE [Myxococcaceae bacterium]
MSESANARPDEASEPSIKVNDKRRFRDDGVPIEVEVTGSAKVDAAEQRSSAELEAARKRIDELARGLQHSESEREAFKQRMLRERDQLLDLEKGRVALVLLDAIDDLELCLSGADESPVSKGVRLIRDGLIRKAEEFGLERVELSGAAYDPNLAEASDMELTPNPGDDGRVISVLKAAWRLKGRVLRPGRVKVAKYVQPAQA